MECPPPLECPPSPPLAIAVNGFPNRARLAKAVVANTVHFVRNIIRSSTLREVPFGGSIGTAVGSSAPSIHSVETFGLLQEKIFRAKEFSRGEDLRVFGHLKRRRNRCRARCVARFKSFSAAAVVKRLNPALPPHSGHLLVRLVGLAAVCIHCQEFVVGRNGEVHLSNPVVATVAACLAPFGKPIPAAAIRRDVGETCCQAGNVNVTANSHGDNVATRDRPPLKTSSALVVRSGGRSNRRAFDPHGLTGAAIANQPAISPATASLECDVDDWIHMPAVTLARRSVPVELASG
jgi:hypothetical protein